MRCHAARPLSVVVADGALCVARRVAPFQREELNEVFEAIRVFDVQAWFRDPPACPAEIRRYGPYRMGYGLLNDSGTSEFYLESKSFTFLFAVDSCGTRRVDEIECRKEDPPSGPGGGSPLPVSPGTELPWWHTLEIPYGLESNDNERGLAASAMMTLDYLSEECPRRGSVLFKKAEKRERISERADKSWEQGAKERFPHGLVGRFVWEPSSNTLRIQLEDSKRSLQLARVGKLYSWTKMACRSAEQASMAVRTQFATAEDAASEIATAIGEIGRRNNVLDCSLRVRITSALSTEVLEDSIAADLIHALREIFEIAPSPGRVSRCNIEKTLLALDVGSRTLDCLSSYIESAFKRRLSGMAKEDALIWDEFRLFHEMQGNPARLRLLYIPVPGDEP